MRGTTKSSPTRSRGSGTSPTPGTSPEGPSRSEASATCGPRTSAPANATSSQGSGSGPARSGSPESPTICPSGPAPARASRSAPPASVGDLTTIATSGPIGSGSSASAALQSSLASRLRTAMDSNGSTLYRLTWKERVTPSGRRICALRASAPRTSGRGCTSWPTPTSALADKGVRSSVNAIREAMRTSGPDLAAAALSSWPTTTKDSSDRGYTYANGDHGGPCLMLPGAAKLSGWATTTTTTRDHKDGASEGTAPINALLGRQVWLAGWAAAAARDHFPAHSEEY